MECVPDLLAKQAALTPEREALAELHSGKSVSYGALNAGAEKTARLLASLGVQPADRAGVLCRNRIEFFEALFACAKLGAICVPLNWRMPAGELKQIIEDFRPAALFVGEEDAGALGECGVDAAVINLDDSGPDGFSARRERAPDVRLREFWSAADPWYLLYTSGTTGKPKAVIQTVQMAVVNYINVRQAIDLRRSDRTLNFLPLFHTAGINLYTLPFLFAGATSQILPGFDLEKTISLLEEGAIDAFFAVPAVYQQISLHPKFDACDLSKVRNWACGGAPLLDLLVEKFAGRGALICNGYGMTETGPTAFLMEEAFVKKKIGSVGRVKLMTAARIVDESGAPVGAGETGEVQFKGPGVTPGYWNQPEATQTAFTADGWLKTGDLARTDEDGFTYIVGRSKEMFISGGENVYPAEIENAYAKHPAILETAVTGIPDDKWGEVGCAYVLLRDGCAVDADELTRFGRERLAAFKVPKHFRIVEDFPRTAAGKVQKHLLPKG